MTGLAPFVWMLVIARCGSAVGRLVNEPTHNSLLADYYAPEQRIRVYSFHRMANAAGQIVGPLAAGVLAAAFGWRAPFLVFPLLTVAVIVFAVIKLREPVRGEVDRLSMGQRQRTRIAMAFLHDPDVVLLDEPHTSLDDEALALLRDVLRAHHERGGAALWAAPARTQAALDVDVAYTVEDGMVVPA